MTDYHSKIRTAEWKNSQAVRSRLKTIHDKLEALDTFHWEDLTDNEVAFIKESQVVITEFMKKRDHGK
jgi:hypothetical protein